MVMNQILLHRNLYKEKIKDCFNITYLPSWGYWSKVWQGIHRAEMN